MGKRLLEVCTGSLRSVQAAVEGEAERIELCSALSLGGLTPSTGLLETVRKLFPKLKIQVLIRPREGHFVYSAEEIALMCLDVRRVIDAGADGVVAGALTDAGDVDEAALERFLRAAEGHDFTFHRAFDRCPRQQKALDVLIKAGCPRVLTSGGYPTAYEGRFVLRELVQQAAGRLIVMPGAGVNAQNIQEILRVTEVVEIHSSASISVVYKKEFESEVPMTTTRTDERGTPETSAEKVRELLKLIH